MKLSPISVEHALAQSSTVTRVGRVERILTRALELLGPEGETWIKNSSRKILGEARVERHPVYVPLQVIDLLKAPSCSTMRYEECVVPAVVGYCSVGALTAATTELAPNDLVISPDADALSVVVSANRMKSIDTIVQVNDMPGSSFWLIGKLFQNAILYARERGL